MYEHDVRNESVTLAVVWTISLAMFAAAAALIWFAAAT